MHKVLELQDISKVFRRGNMLSMDKITAVDRVSLHVNQAEIFGLAGESGCGKTTISRMAMGFEDPTSGGITYWGKDGKVAKGKKVWRTSRSIEIAKVTPACLSDSWRRTATG